MITNNTVENLPMSVTISRITGIEEGNIQISIKDENSNIDFIKISIDFADFAKCITGLAASPCKGTVSGLNIVGKTMQMDTLEFEMPENSHYSSGRVEIARKIAKEKCPKGWDFDTGFHSQSSFFTKDNKNYARCTIRRWITI